MLRRLRHKRRLASALRSRQPAQCKTWQQAAADLLYPLLYAMYQTEDLQAGIAAFKDREQPTFHDR